MNPKYYKTHVERKSHHQINKFHVGDSQKQHIVKCCCANLMAKTVLIIFTVKSCTYFSKFFPSKMPNLKKKKKTSEEKN